MGAAGSSSSSCAPSRGAPCFAGLLGASADGGEPGSAAAAAAARAEPIRVAISGAAGQIGYSLLPMIASGAMFGPGQRVILQCLDLNLPDVTENMRALEMELRDGNFPLLQEVFFTVDDAKAFMGADYALLLGAFPQQEGKDRRYIMEKNTIIFRTLGHAIENNASKDCKVLAAAHPACTIALLCAYYAPSLPKENFFGLTRLDQNRAIGQIANRAGVGPGDVRNVTIWGAWGNRPDLDRCTVKGKPMLSVLHREEDKHWLDNGFVTELANRGANINKARKASSAMSAARAITGHVWDLHCGTRPGESTSMGVWSDGNEYGISEGLMFSMPVVCLGRGRYQVATGLQIGVASRTRITAVEKELLSDRELAQELARKHGLSVGAPHG